MKKILYTLLFFPILAVGQTTTENYSKVTTYRKPTTVLIQNPEDTIAKIDITYYDGLGRPIQKIANKQSAIGNNIVTHIEYDQMGRVEKEYLPYVSTNGTLDFISNGQTNTLNYTDYQGQNPYSQKFFEASPLSRVLKQAAPGLAWEGHATDDDDHTIKFVNQTNDSLEVKHFKATTQWDNTLKLYLPTLVDNGFYNKHELYKIITKDENWILTDGSNNTTEEFKDKEGKVILKKNYNDGEAHETYYVYDIYGNLTFVIPPKADVSQTITNEILEKLCYQYRYDERNRLVEKKFPEKQWEFIVYDKLDRVVATGPAFTPYGGNQIGWMISKYDVFNRVVYTAWKEQRTITNSERKKFQNDMNNSTILNENKTGSNVDNFANQYSSQVIPLTGYILLTINYYDDYSFPNAPTPTGTVLGQNIEQNVKGLQTGSWVRALTAPNESLATTNYTFYDGKYRVLESHSYNYLGGYTKVKSIYNFEGLVLLTNTKHKGTTGNIIEIQEEFEYTPQGRLLNHYHKINNQPKELIAHNEYNELGQLISKNVGGDDVVNNSGLQKVNYSYNIRGWLTAINDINALNVIGAPTDLFAFKINYDQVEDDLNGTVKNLYNGNISETFWKSSSDNIKRKYGYSYDNLNRLLNAQYQKPDSNTSLTNSYNESLSYDKNGNITSLLRNGEWDDDVNVIEIDNLDYTYENNSNRLSIVHDNTLDPNGFKDDSDTDPFDQIADYDYDDNGNMTKDDNKGITSIVYNHLNLPTEINFGGTGRIIYLYDATGKKMSKKVHINNNTADVVTNYLDGFQYKNDIIQFFPTAEGYANRLNSVYDTGNYFQVPKDEPDLFGYVYNYTDHLGSIRLSYTKEKSTNVLKIVEENHYYPFGLKHNNYNSSKMLYAKEGQIEKQKPLPPYMAMSYNYKYTGKEYQEELGLNTYDYGARNYDPALGRWMCIDKLANKYVDKSPYNYAFNNPVNMLDPDGNFVISAAFARKYPNITRYLRGNFKSDVMNNTTILDALFEVSRQDGNPKNPGLFTANEVECALTDNSGPNIEFYPLVPANGEYNPDNNTIYLDTSRMDFLEKALASSELDNEKKVKALLGGFMLVLHELAHYGDFLDGVQTKTDERGYELENILWWWIDLKDKMPTARDSDKFKPVSQTSLLRAKKNVLPTLPKENMSKKTSEPSNVIPKKLPQYPGSAGPANKKTKTLKG